MMNSKLIQRLSPAPVLGVSLARVSMLRLDLAGGLAPGNKLFKLNENFTEAQRNGNTRLASFGGAWSNHLHALAALGHERGFESIGIVRGEKPAAPSAMLCDAARWGMQLRYVSRSDYRQRNSPEFVAALLKDIGPCHIIPEGGANTAGAMGCKAIAQLLPTEVDVPRRIVLAVGTGTTLAGIAAALPCSADIVGVAVLKGASDLGDRVRKRLQDLGANQVGSWRVAHDHHCGGYARVSPELKAFILEFERVHKIPLDPVYTGKALFAVFKMVQTGDWDGEIIAIHTGGLQGRRGYPWLSGFKVEQGRSDAQN